MNINNEVYQKIFYILLSIAVFAALHFFMVTTIAPRGNVISENWQIRGPEITQTVDAPFSFPLTQIGRYRMTNSFHASTDEALVLNHLSFQAFQVYINNTLVYQAGSFLRPTGNLQNYTFVIPLPPAQDNEYIVEIIGHAAYKVEIPSEPFVIQEDRALTLMGFSNFLYNDLLLLCIGASFLIGIVLISHSFHHSQKFGHDFFMGLSAIFAALFCLDYVYFASMGPMWMFFTIDKILMGFGYIGPLCFLIGLELYYIQKIKFGTVASILTGISVLVIFTSPTFRFFADVLRVTNLILLVNMLASVFYIFSKQRRKPFLLIPAMLLTLSILHLTASMILHLGWPVVVQYVVLFSAVLFSINLVMEFNELFHQNKELEEKFNKDPLTGAFNRHALFDLKLDLFQILVLIDLDNFKVYNDTYGHAAGDELLVIFTQAVMENLRKDDVVIRSGGDEFLLFLREIDIQLSKRIVERIGYHFLQNVLYPDAGFSYGITKITGNRKEDLEKADAKMYAMKSEHKQS
ncbi:MAG: GGDEF domain-containing protein [Spirochaetia bacterium]